MRSHDHSIILHFVIIIVAILTDETFL